METLSILLGVIVSIAIMVLPIIIVISSKRAEKKRWEEQRLQKEKRIQDELNLWTEKIKKHDIVNRWIEEATSHCENEIKLYPERDQKFEFLAFIQEFAFGRNLQQKYLVNMRETIYCERPEYFFVYNFTKNNLPDLKSNELNPFTKAFAESVKNQLIAKGINVRISKTLACVNSNGDNDYDEETERFIYYITYTHQTVNSTW